MSGKSDFPKREFRSRQELRDWLRANHARADTFWLVSFKKHGLIMPAGSEKIVAAKNDGSWTYLDEIENLVIPDDLANALQANKTAKDEFDAFTKSAKKVILLWIKTAKRSETRAERIGETVRLAAKGLRAAHPEARGH